MLEANTITVASLRKKHAYQKYGTEVTPFGSPLLTLLIIPTIRKDSQDMSR